MRTEASLIIPMMAIAGFSCNKQAEVEKPNVLFILADDLGIGDLACYDNPYLDTPVLDQLAAEGARLTRCYAASPLCAPSRAAILTGRYNHRTGDIDVSSNRGIDRIALKEKTMGDYFRSAGYKTAIFGKWHSGIYNNDYLPHNRGFDLFYGFPNGIQDYHDWNLMRNGINEKHDGRYLTDVLNEESIRFIEDNASQPFLLFLSHHAPHSPFQAPDSLIRKYRERNDGSYSDDVAILYAMIEAMDIGLGRVFDKISELGLKEKTIIVFTSDNGGFVAGNMDRFKAGLSGNKGDVLEEGIRVPGIVSWPGHIRKGKLVNTPITGIDWLPTLFSLTGSNPPENALPFDGENLMPVFLNKIKIEPEERILYFQKTRYTPVKHSDAAIIAGNWKLYWPGIPETMKKDNLRDGPSVNKGTYEEHWEMPIDYEIPAYENVLSPPAQLFNLSDDPYEKTDVSSSNPVLVDSLTILYNSWFDSVYKDWEKAFKEIIEHDKAYWKDRTIPDPRILFKDYWDWPRAKSNPEKDDPLKVFRGYWDYYPVNQIDINNI